MQRRISWKVMGLLGATAVVAAGVSLARPAKSSDHQDAPTVKADPASDINDVYTFMDATTGNAVFVMTVFPFADTTSKFSDATKYVFHTTSGAQFGDTTSSTDIIVTFDASQTASVWVGTDDYVTGDASGTTGLKSATGKTTVFAGRRADPFFFNLGGFKDTVKSVEAAAGGLTPDPTAPTSGCYKLDQGTITALSGELREADSDAGAPTRVGTDDFKTAQGLAIVVSVDKSLVTKGGPIVSVWGATTQ